MNKSNPQNPRKGSAKAAPTQSHLFDPRLQVVHEITDDDVIKAPRGGKTTADTAAKGDDNLMSEPPPRKH